MSVAGLADSVEMLASALRANLAWTGAFLERLGVAVGLDGRFDAAAACRALDAAARLYEERGGGDSLAGAEMGPSEESCRAWLVAQLAEYGVKVVGRGLRCAARFTLELQDGRTVRALTYVSLRSKASGQCGFTAGHLTDEDIEWYLFIAKPLGRVFLRRRIEVLSRLRLQPGQAPPSAAAVTFSRSSADVLEARVGELLGDSAAATVEGSTPEGASA